MCYDRRQKGGNDMRTESTGSPPFLAGKRVLVTGGGGSIGSELCRQAAAQHPDSLAILEISENGAWDIQQELWRQYGSTLPFRVEIGSIRDRARLAQLMRDLKPDLVLHAAAHKHLPLLENNPQEAVKNNVFGTLNVLEAAEEAGCGRFVLISSDKAVHPTSVLGATKRLTERMVEVPHGGMICSAVRFGNVIGSAGSVIPLFRQQIAAGGPVTITDRRMTRYFLSIPDAASLVLEAARIAEGGEIFVLDMGKPVSILALAEHMIREAGLTPWTEVPIVFTGLRPGEKLSEELFTSEEELSATRIGGILRTQPASTSPAALSEALALLSRSLDASPGKVREALMAAVPEYRPAQ
ncbi:MAG TPA: polysaccharide biosynthesis protein [Candidatus Merdivicinus faecavium]|nr:polysaccharide biosynthesis protein [Candidatus Merdivicinus faecavium]